VRFALDDRDQPFDKSLFIRGDRRDPEALENSANSCRRAIPLRRRRLKGSGALARMAAAPLDAAANLNKIIGIPSLRLD
jgi:hypothetical protein